MNKTVTVNDVLNILNELAPFDGCESYDNVGLMVGDGDKEVKKIGVVLDITSDSVSYAAQNGVDLIVSHHPTIFYPLKSIGSNSVVYKLVKNSISAIACHTNLDNTGFVNSALAEKLSLENVTTLADGHTVCGELAKPLDVSQAAKYIKDKLNAGGVSYTGEGEVQRIALASGAGFDSIDIARESGADMLLTSDVKHSAFIEAAESGMPLVCADHFDTENPLVVPLANYLAEKLGDSAEVTVIPQTSVIKHTK